MIRPARTAAVAVLGAGGATLALWLPWLRSGARARDAFETARSARELDLLAGWPASGTVLALAFLPALVAAAVLALVLRRPNLGAGLAGIAGAVVLLGAIAIGRVDVPSTAAAPGAVVGAVAGAAGVAAALLSTVTATADRLRVRRL